jgi:hypothetical protein
VPAARRAAEDLSGHLRRANVHVSVAGPAALGAVADADIVLLQAVAGDPAALDLAARRARRPTVFVLDPADVGSDGRLTADAARLLARCGAAVAPTDGGRDLLRSSVDGGVRAITVAPVMRADRYRELARAHVERIPRPLDVIGWAPAADGSAVADAIEAALAEILESRPGARVDLVRGGARLAGHPHVRRLSNDLQPVVAARWSLFVTADGNQPPLDLEPAVLAEVGVLGVPSLVPTGWARAPGRVLVDGSELAASWLDVITHLLDEVPTREELAYEAAASAECLQRPSAADAVVNRFLGWIDRGPR